MRTQHVQPGEIAVAIGDGANDLPMLRQADVSIAYHANPVVRAQARYAINHCGLDAVLNLFA
jgi:phosphoserine phosphatase